MSAHLEESQYTIIAFYKFVELSDLPTLQTALLQCCKEQSILGTILIANEGINGTIAGTDKNIAVLVDLLHSYAPFADLKFRYTYADFNPFYKMKVRLKKEIVALGVPDIYPAQKTGTQVPPETWDTVIADPEVLLIDTRNTYEFELGTFTNAINPETDVFRDFPAYVKQNLDPNKHKKIAMFCTGGIRCEKASSYLLEQGFSEIYQLQGGILNYLEKIPTENSTWEGECFIFDNRITV
jgi:UPF0176 protein